ncbi:MAG: FHA domain-containing protein, partial [Chloroflexota bacterium]
MMTEKPQKPSTDDLSKTEYGKTWALSEDNSISQALSEMLLDALEDEIEHLGAGILLYIANQTKPIVITDRDIIRLGRIKKSEDPNALDLSEYYAKELGVSRKHAEITYKDGDYLIKDDGSTNG